MTINEKIKREMNCRGWSIYKLSKISGVSKTAIKGWFSEVPTTPRIASVKLVAKAFKMKPEQLIADNLEQDAQTKEMNELWARLGTSERKCIITVMNTIIEHK